jgi:hypothetical protein
VMTAFVATGRHPLRSCSRRGNAKCIAIAEAPPTRRDVELCPEVPVPVRAPTSHSRETVPRSDLPLSGRSRRERRGLLCLLLSTMDCPPARWS